MATYRFVPYQEAKHPLWVILSRNCPCSPYENRYETFWYLARFLGVISGGDWVVLFGPSFNKHFCNVSQVWLYWCFCQYWTIARGEVGDQWCLSSPSWSKVRLVGWMTNMTTSSCRAVRLITHELLHTLGLHHHHERVDRDKHVKIHWANIRVSYTGLVQG